MIVLSDLTKYGAILAKVSVMRRSLLGRGEYLELAHKQTVAEAASYLKNETAYGSVLSAVNESDTHRAELERLMKRSLLDDVVRLYRFDNNENKRFYTFMYIKEEIELVKNFLRRLINHETPERHIEMPDLFVRHLTIRPERLVQSRNMQEFLENLRGSRYEAVIAPLLSSSEHRDLFSVEMTLDMYYYSVVEKLREEMTDKEDKEVISMTSGSEIDALNLLYIYRCINYFHMPSEQIYSLLIPNQYRLSKSDIISLAESPGTEEFLLRARKTPYRAIFAEREDGFYDRNYLSYIYHLHERAAKKYPYSIETPVSYLHFKDTEIHNITTIIEGIRYGLPPEEIIPYVVGFKLAAAVRDGLPQ